MARQVSEQQVDAIVKKVLSELQAQPNVVTRRVTSPAPPPPTTKTASVAAADGIFADVDAAVTAARRAYEALDQLTLEKRKEIIAAIRAEMIAHAEELAKQAHTETGLGRWEDKVKKNLLCAQKTPGPEYLEPVSWSGDHGLTLVERAPYGVVAAITPTTNP